MPQKQHQQHAHFLPLTFQRILNKYSCFPSSRWRAHALSPLLASIPVTASALQCSSSESTFFTLVWREKKLYSTQRWVFCRKMNAHRTHTQRASAAAADVVVITVVIVVDSWRLAKTTSKRKRKKWQKKKINVQSTRVLCTQFLRSFIISVAV